MDLKIFNFGNEFFFSFNFQFSELFESELKLFKYFLEFSITSLLFFENHMFMYVFINMLIYILHILLLNIY